MVRSIACEHSLAHKLNRTEVVLGRVDEAIVRACNDVAHCLGIATVAESVESDAQLALLRDMGLNYAQGFVYDRPRPLADFAAAPEATKGDVAWYCRMPLSAASEGRKRCFALRLGGEARGLPPASIFLNNPALVAQAQA